MAKRTTIIDIGSNSITLVIYEKSSRYGFFLIEKSRSRVRIGENAYESGGKLSDEAMEKAFHTLVDFKQIALAYKCKKIFCVATSALRDAPNKRDFILRVRRELKLNIKVIDGEKEAYFGALAGANLLPPIDEATTIDIGGGSTELAKIKDGKIVDTISLDIGTVRLKELFFDQKAGIEEAKKYIDTILKKLPENFYSSKIIGIGGTIRALSSAIMKKESYPIDNLHAFTYEYDIHQNFIKEVSTSTVLGLKDMPISSSRYDTIREGSTIFSRICDFIGAKEIITSKAGVREGVYLHDILRSSHGKFPQNFNVSIKSLQDRFALLPRHSSHTQRVCKRIYNVLYDEFDNDKIYAEELFKAAKLLHIVKRLNIYSNSDQSFFFLLENLNFSLSHEEKLLIAILLRFSQKGKIDKKKYKRYKELLPSYEVLEWLVFVLCATEALTRNKSLNPIECQYDQKVLAIKSNEDLFLAKEAIKKIYKPKAFAIEIEKVGT